MLCLWSEAIYESPNAIDGRFGDFHCMFLQQNTTEQSGTTRATKSHDALGHVLLMVTSDWGKVARIAVFDCQDGRDSHSMTERFQKFVVKEQRRDQ